MNNYYERFLSTIYDDCPYFGLGRQREIDKFNEFYYRHLDIKLGRVLEFGPGTGMLTVPLARLGYQLDSVDLSPDMHFVLSEKLKVENVYVYSNVNQIVGDATTYRGDSLYNSIVMPEGILIAIPDLSGQISLLKNCYRNLNFGGRLYTDFFQPRYDLIHEGTLTEYSRFRAKSGDRYLLTMRFRNNKYTQIQNWEATFTLMNEGKKTDIVRVNIQFRYLFYSEIMLMLEQVGFRVVSIDVTYAEGRGFAVVAEKS